MDARDADNAVRALKYLYRYIVLSPLIAFPWNRNANMGPVMSTGMNTGSSRRPRITRSEAAKILKTSYENIRRLQRVGQLRSEPDRHGVHRFDRREVEALARRRGLQISPTGELAARVFRLIKDGRSFHDIVIDTEQEPPTILALWEQYRSGFSGPTSDAAANQNDREQQEHEEQMRALDLELARRRAELNNDGKKRR